MYFFMYNGSVVLKEIKHYWQSLKKHHTFLKDLLKTVFYFIFIFTSFTITSTLLKQLCLLHYIAEMEVRDLSAKTEALDPSRAEILRYL